MDNKVIETLTLALRIQEDETKILEKRVSKLEKIVKNILKTKILVKDIN